MLSDHCNYYIFKVVILLIINGISISLHMKTVVLIICILTVNVCRNAPALMATTVLYSSGVRVISCFTHHAKQIIYIRFTLQSVNRNTTKCSFLGNPERKKKHLILFRNLTFSFEWPMTEMFVQKYGHVCFAVALEILCVKPVMFFLSIF